jgi:hypothetical protein
MTLPITITNTFATATGSIPLSQLDTNFSLLASTINGIGDGTTALATPAISGGAINSATVGATTPATGAFTSLSCTSRGGALTANSGLTAVTAVAGSLTLATGGMTLTSQTATAGSVWRVRAYGTYAAASSANVRQLTMSCYWGTTQLTAITTSNVLASTAQTTAWSVEFEISTTSTTAAWTTGILSSQVTSATIPLNAVATPASVTVTAGAQTLDFRVGQTGTATATDIINVHQVVMERIE